MNSTTSETTSNFIFPVQLTPDADDGGYTVMFPDLPEAITQGDSVAECLTEAGDCLEEAIAARIDDNLPIPQPSQLKSGEYLVELPLTMVFKALVYLAFRETGMNQTQLAQQLNLDEREIRRILDPRHGTKLATMERVLFNLGKKIEIRLIASQ
jgi:antitoxin HicB